MTRGQTTSCSVTVSGAPAGTQIAYANWTFTGGGVTVNRPGNNNVASWSGTMVIGGTVGVAVTVGSLPAINVSASVTVNPRNFHTNPATAIQAANGSSLPDDTSITLPVPPQSTGSDSGLGQFREATGDLGISLTVIGDSGPNNGFAYHASTLAPDPAHFFFDYVINPDLENSVSVFSQHQCGNYDPNTNPGGFISWATLLAQTRRHEFNSALQSHYVFYSNALNSSANNPGDFYESQVASPGTNLANFNDATRTSLNTRYNQIGALASIEPFAVNQSETGRFLGNINICAVYTLQLSRARR